MVHIVNLIGSYNNVTPFVVVIVPIEGVRVVRSHSCTRNNGNIIIIIINTTRCIGGTVT
jgi:stringent starvation protein B